MSYLRSLSDRFPAFSVLAVLLALVASSAVAADKRQPLPPPAHAQAPTPAVTDDYVHKEFGDNCSLLSGFPQFTGDLDGDGIDDLVIVARCKNPMADRDEYSFQISDPFDTYIGFGDVKVTSAFGPDEPERRGICLLVVHGAEKNAWRAEKPKGKFLLINLPFKTLTVKRLTLRKRIALAVYMEEKGEGDSNSSVVFWDGRKYKYQPLGSTME